MFGHFPMKEAPVSFLSLKNHSLFSQRFFSGKDARATDGLHHCSWGRTLSKRAEFTALAMQNYT